MINFQVVQHLCQIKNMYTTSIYLEKVGGIACFTTSEQTVQRNVPSACGIFLKYSHTALLGRLSADPIEAISEEDPASPVSPLNCSCTTRCHH